ncbi:MAG: ThuA domain-containing protein [Verrucomicrobia bacterium]|nr:ThuA domain-containing protein [Verrucomicrobiota bacterium]
MKIASLIPCAAFVILTALPWPCVAEPPIKVMIIGGQNNHDWKKSTPFLKEMLDKNGHFEAVVNNAPPDLAAPEAAQAWQPKFSDFDCVVLDYNGQVVRENAGEGRGMGHGDQYDWLMTTRDPNHSITWGLPLHWLHKHDELYHGQRGPAENVHILLTAYSDPAPGRGGTGKDEPIVWWVPYGKGKVVVNLMGHVGELGCMQCVGFQTVTCRACERVATGHGLTSVPNDFPTAEKVSLRQ